MRQRLIVRSRGSEFPCVNKDKDEFANPDGCRGRRIRDFPLRRNRRILQYVANWDSKNQRIPADKGISSLSTAGIS